MRRASFFAYLLVCVLAGGLVAGCASTAKMAAPSPMGEWDYTILNTPQGDATGTMTINAEGDLYSGEISSEMLGQVVSMTDVAFTDSTFSFKATFDAGGQLIDTASTLTLRGATMKGMMEVVGFGEFEITAMRKPPATEM